tara:strand:- start:847 stop:1374 length:528 start_codon:yes stop_codon:yes gene_type:complete
MKISKLSIPGCYKIFFKPNKDTRGFFTRTYCKKEFKKFKINDRWVQNNLSLNKYKNTLRGLHYQTRPFEEDKLVRCVHGSVIDYILDLRKKSKTYMKLLKIKLSDKNFLSVYVPRGCAHGYITLQNNTILSYSVTNYYSKKNERTFPFFDKRLKIKFPIKPKYISKKDLKPKKKS